MATVAPCCHEVSLPLRLLPWRLGCSWWSRFKFNSSFFVHFPTLGHYFSNTTPGAGWLDGKGHLVSATPQPASALPCSPVQMRVEHQLNVLHLGASLLFPASAPWTAKLNFASQRLGWDMGAFLFREPSGAWPHSAASNRGRPMSRGPIAHRSQEEEDCTLVAPFA